MHVLLFPLNVTYMKPKIPAMAKGLRLVYSLANNQSESSHDQVTLDQLYGSTCIFLWLHWVVFQTKFSTLAPGNNHNNKILRQIAGLLWIYTSLIISKMWHQLVKYKEAFPCERISTNEHSIFKNTTTLFSFEAFCLVLNRNKDPLTNWCHVLEIINKVYTSFFVECATLLK